MADITETNPQRRAVLLAVQKMLEQVQYGRITVSVPAHNWQLGKMSRTVEITEDLTPLASKR